VTFKTGAIKIEFIAHQVLDYSYTTKYISLFKLELHKITLGIVRAITEKVIDKI